MTMTGQEDAIPARNGGSELVDYSLKESNRRLILERRKVALLTDRNGAYNSSTNDVISVTIAPGANDEWLDGRSSYITATLKTSSTTAGVAQGLYLPNGPAACFQQVQLLSASGQQLVNIMDYNTIQQMFTEWTTCPTWVSGAGQIYGAGNWETGDFDPARYLAGNASGTQLPPAQAVTGFTAYTGTAASGTFAYNTNPTTYNPFSTNVLPKAASTTATDAIGADSVLEQSAGKALALQQGLSTTNGVRVAFRLDLAWIFGNATLIPAQYFPLTLRCTLAGPQQSLSYIGVDSGIKEQYAGRTGYTAGTWDGTGPLSVINGNTKQLPGVGLLTATCTAATPVELSFNNVKFMASLCKVSPTFKSKVESEMSHGTFSMTVTNYYTALNSIPSGVNSTTVNTTFSAHDCQAYYITLIPQAGENTLGYNFGYKWGGMTNAGLPWITSTQLLLNGRYFPPQPNSDTIDQFHDTLDAFNISSENVAFSPVSYSSYVAGRNFALGVLLDRDQGSSLTGVSSVSSPVWTWQAYFSANTPYVLNVHTCIAYTQVLEVLKDGQIKIFQ